MSFLVFTFLNLRSLFLFLRHFLFKMFFFLSLEISIMALEAQPKTITSLIGENSNSMPEQISSTA